MKDIVECEMKGVKSNTAIKKFTSAQPWLWSVFINNCYSDRAAEMTYIQHTACNLPLAIYD